MAYDYSFKKFSNTSRQYAPEESFNAGMNYTDAPIDPGSVKFMLNYDLADDGTSLKPRAGIRANITAVSKESVEEALKVVNSNGNFDTTYQIAFAYEYEFEFKKYICVVLLSDVYDRVAIGTIKDKTEMINNVTLTTDIEHTTTKDFVVTLTEITARTFKYWSENNIHDLTFKNPSAFDGINAGKSVGTQAWNGDYYFFGTDTNSKQKLYHTVFNEFTHNFTVEAVVPTELTALEASPNKFNMLLENPYKFQNSIVAGAFVLQGIICYQGNDIVVSPRINTNYKYKLAYTTPSNTTYKIDWEWKDYNGTSWITMKSETIAITDTAPDITCNLSVPIASSLLRVTVTKEGESYPEQVLAIGINCESEVQKNASNASSKTYSLYAATGMCFWQNRLVLWGFADPIIFVSDTNLPEWFPYPNNTDLFEEPVIHCEPYLDSLLVFTTQKLYKLTMLSDGSGWTKTCIQDHLYLTDLDARLVQTIKNMIFFKSGNSFYMVVPSASTSAGLTIAPIGKPIQSFLDNFSKNVKDILKDVYSYTRNLDLTYCFSYIDYNDIVIQYVFDYTRFTNKFSNYVNFCLIYDTENRTWRTHIFESNQIYSVLKQDATKSSTFIAYDALSGRIPYDDFLNYTTTGAVLKVPDHDISYPFIQILNKDLNNPEDFYVPTFGSQYHYYPTATISVEIVDENGGIISFTETAQATDIPSYHKEIDEAFKEIHYFLNYQYLDTGFRTLDYPHNKKRFREFQIRINNKSKGTLNFGTSFYIDEDCRRNMYKYKVIHDLESSSENYKEILVVPEIMLDTVVQGSTILGETQEDINAWALDKSMFSDSSLVKVRTSVSGKGYHNRLKLISTNETDYELLSLCWVFKYKNLR